jgi:dethiobiotin synthetase
MTRTASRGLFVTGTDTGVGKTQVAAALASLIRDHGIHVDPRKPVESGCRRIGDRLLAEDALCLRDAARSDSPPELICRYPLEPALSPERAAILSGITLGLDDLVAACTEGSLSADFLLVEGAGGFYSPLAPGVLNADLASALGLTVVLVTSDRLGTIGPTLLTAEAIERRGLLLAGVVLNRIEPSIDPRMGNAADLSQWLHRPVIVTDRHGSDDGKPVWTRLRPALAALADGLSAEFPRSAP